MLTMCGCQPQRADSECLCTCKGNSKAAGIPTPACFFQLTVPYTWAPFSGTSSVHFNQGNNRLLVGPLASTGVWQSQHGRALPWKFFQFAPLPVPPEQRLASPAHREGWEVGWIDNQRKIRFLLLREKGIWPNSSPGCRAYYEPFLPAHCKLPRTRGVLLTSQCKAEG